MSFKFAEGGFSKLYVKYVQWCYTGGAVRGRDPQQSGKNIFL